MPVRRCNNPLRDQYQDIATCLFSHNITSVDQREVEQPRSSSYAPLKWCVAYSVTCNDGDIVSEDKKEKLKVEDDEGDKVVDKLRLLKHEMISGPPELWRKQAKEEGKVRPV